MVVRTHASATYPWLGLCLRLCVRCVGADKYRDPLIRRYASRAIHVASSLRLPASGRRTVELGARSSCAARRRPAPPGRTRPSLGQALGGPGPNVCGPPSGARGFLGRPPPPSAARARVHLFGEAARYRLRPRECATAAQSGRFSSIQAARRVCAQPPVVIKARSTVLSLPVSG